ncbi:hypothetical protein NA57DRAFT_70475 [Rhizodiscina lignyota]|uniref:Cupin type-2 domain-containing protein n=1 Tax=Rhizodiscina lignyota TaxID=1504668 RepID=A0A9P4MBD7_9PEZI|nr:hypothetical protein NA57DRAFT_70475 [Rhizodiscina lignyota]
MAYPSFRRVVTGHSSSGRAIITNDDTLYPGDFFVPSERAQEGAFGATFLFRTTAAPESNNAPFEDPANKSQPISEAVSSNWRIIDFPPNSTAPFHRTLSVDFGVVIKGEVVIELEDGVETVLKEQDGVVQRGTVHAWHNRTAENARMIFVILPAEPVKVEETGEILKERQIGE